MFISEIFYSLQGEGSLIGVPSVFVRTSGCNLRCRWCDTPYASWNPEGTTFHTEELLKKITSYSCRHIVLTGGEPMISPDLPKLAADLNNQGHHITIETAGTIMPQGISCHLASLSPKLKNSIPDSSIAGSWSQRHASHRYSPDVISTWISHYDTQLKFVVTNEEDLSEIEDILQEITPIPRDRVFLMPEGTDLITLKKRTPFIEKICRERGFRFAPRLQIELYGNMRGT